MILKPKLVYYKKVNCKSIKLVFYRTKNDDNNINYRRAVEGCIGCALYCYGKARGCYLGKILMIDVNKLKCGFDIYGNNRYNLQYRYIANHVTEEGLDS